MISSGGSEVVTINTRFITAALLAAVALLSFAPFAGAAATPLANCVTLIDQPDMGERVCYDPKAECKVWQERVTFTGTHTYCLVGKGAGHEGPDCYARYWELDAGVVRVVSKDSCSYEVYADGISFYEAGPGACMERYWQYGVGDFTVVSRNTCHYDVYYQGKPLLD